MKPVLLGCATALGSWLLGTAAVGAYIVFVHGARPTAVIGIALAAGALLAIAVGLLVAAARSFLERAAVVSGGTAYPKEGEKVVLVGQMESLDGRRLKAPLDGADCLMYRYTLKYTGGQGERRSAGTLAHGVAVLPSQIETATGTWKLLAVPTLLGNAPTNGADARARQFESYARRTSFTPVGKQAGDALLAEWKDADGDYQSDVSFEDVRNIDRQDLQTEQHSVAPGDNVCVIGRFSATRGGIVPGPQPTRLIVGDVAQLASKLGREVITRTLIALLLLAPLVVAAVLAQQRPTARATTVSLVTLTTAQA